MKWEKNNFSQEFQDAILACLITYPEDFYAFGEIVKPAYFNGPAASELVFRLLEYKKKYGKYPTFTTLGNYAYHKAARVNIDHAKETLDYVEKLAGIGTSDKTEMIGLAMPFLKERAIYDGIRKIHAAQSEGKMGDIRPVEIMREAMTIDTKLKDLGFSIYHHHEQVLDTITDRTYGVHTGYAEFNNLWRFGWAPGWLIVLLAPPKRYKTAFAINLALNIAQGQDADVLYYACEISQELAALRALTNITGWTQDQFRDELERGKLIAAQAVREKLLGNILFKSFPSKSASISDIKLHAHQVINLLGLRPKAIVIDYAETVRPDSADVKSPDWRQQADIYTQARAMGAELGCCVIMPDRCNKETVGKKVPSMKSFQGAFEKAAIVDAAIGLCATDEEYLQNRIRYFVFLNRHGEALKQFGGTVDPDRMVMTVGTEIEYNPDDEAE